MTVHRMLAVLAVLALLFFYPAYAFALPEVVAQSAVLVDMHTGKILYNKNGDVKKPPASTTKILTALVALEQGRLHDKIVVSPNATKVEPNVVWLRAGEEQTMENLLYALLLNSANDAAIAIAEAVGGSVEGFAGMMTNRARKLGAKNSNFTNPHGLPDPEHYTTALDLALIAREAMHNQKFREIVGTKTIPWNGMDWKSNLVNLNKLLWTYDGATGVKTGYTSDAAYCLVAAALRGQEEYLAVILGSSREAVYEDAKALLDYGFDNFQAVKLVEAGQEIMYLDNLPVVAGSGMKYILGGQQTEVPRWDIRLNEIKAPVEKGEEIGRINFLVDGRQVGTVPLLSGAAIPRNLTWTDWYLRLTLTFFTLMILNAIRKKLKRRKKRFLYSGKRYNTRNVHRPF